MSKSAFERYAPFIQEYIYRKKWTELREVQVEACEAIMDTDNHVIIASGTASGKTEAAFFPILTLLEEKPASSIGVMYIGPLKALINDQFERLDELLREHDIPVWPWHGDISPSVKKKALKTAQGILQITPESLEAMLMRHPGDAGRLFSDLRFIVIDEIHALMGEDRGLQLLCLLSRLEKLTGCSPRRIGLSATLNDYQPAMNYLSSGSIAETIAVGIHSHKRTISLCVESFISTSYFPFIIGKISIDFVIAMAIVLTLSFSLLDNFVQKFTQYVKSMFQFDWCWTKIFCHFCKISIKFCSAFWGEFNHTTSSIEV